MYKISRLVSGLAVTALACLVLVGCGQVQSDLDMPRLEVRRPLNNSFIDADDVLLEGYTDQPSVLVNGKWFGVADGEISISYPLEPGQNDIDVSAGNRAGTTTVRLQVIRR